MGLGRRTWKSRRLTRTEDMSRESQYGSENESSEIHGGELSKLNRCLRVVVCFLVVCEKS